MEGMQPLPSIYDPRARGPRRGRHGLRLCLVSHLP